MQPLTFSNSKIYKHNPLNFKRGERLLIFFGFFYYNMITSVTMGKKPCGKNAKW